MSGRRALMEYIQKILFKDSSRLSLIILKRNLHMGILSSERYERSFLRCCQRTVNSNSG